MFSHDYAKWSHSRKRYYERYGRDIEEKELARIKEVLQTTEPKNGFNYYEIPWGGTILKLIYEPDDKEITTFLPQDADGNEVQVGAILAKKLKNGENIYKLPNTIKVRLYRKAKNAKVKEIYFAGICFDKEKCLKFYENPYVRDIYDKWLEDKISKKKKI